MNSKNINTSKFGDTYRDYSDLIDKNSVALSEPKRKKPRWKEILGEIDEERGDNGIKSHHSPDDYEGFISRLGYLSYMLVILSLLAKLELHC